MSSDDDQARTDADAAPGAGVDLPAPATGPDDGEDPHAPEGLDLARAAARAAAAGPAGPRKLPRATSDPSLFRRRTGGSRMSGAHPDDRDPQLLGPSLERLVSRRGWDMDLKVQGVFGRWAELVGDDVAGHSTPETLDGGKLVVRTDSTAWATQLKLLAPTVVRRLNEELGHGTVDVLEVLGPHLPTWKKGPRSVRDGRGPRDTYG